MPLNDRRDAILVSACLLDVKCNHRGLASSAPAVERLADNFRLIPVCPETLGGLPTPRAPAEIQDDGTVRTADGTDVTDAYERGAAAAVALVRASGARRAVLKSRSPSCGCEQVYDGTFSRTLRSGEGVTVSALRREGIEVISDENTDGLEGLG